MFIPEPKKKCYALFYRFRIYKTSTLIFLSKVKNEKYYDFQVFGNTNEFLEVRIYLDDYGNIDNVSVMHNSFFDGEQAILIAKYLIKCNKCQF